MTFPFLETKPSVLVEAQKAKFKPHAVVQVLIFLALFYVLSMLVPQYTRKGVRALFEMAGADFPAWLRFWLLAIPIALYVLYVRFVERRSLYSMGFVRKGALRQYGFGLIVGVVMLAAVLGISLVSGSLNFEGILLNGSVATLLAWFVGFAIQSMNEEVVMRGYFLVSLANRAPIAVAVFISSIFFGVVHLANPGISALPVVNIVLASGFMACYFLRTDNIWAVAGYHAMWNYCMGNILGISVSGNAPATQVFSFSQSEAMSLINGGQFGLEGGLATTIVLITSILLVVFLPKRK